MEKGAMIRRFSFSDLDAILEIERQAFPKSGYDWATFVNLHWRYPETFLVYVEITEGWKQGQIWGYIVFTPEGHIISIAVHPIRRKRGIGTELMGRVLSTPRIKNLSAEVRKSNTGAQTFYRRLGFQVVGSIPHYYGDEDALLVRKKVSPVGS
jgi:[ribosomal protein S18]-alanine N-acetyltransferase